MQGLRGAYDFAGQAVPAGHVALHGAAAAKTARRFGLCFRFLIAVMGARHGQGFGGVFLLFRKTMEALQTAGNTFVAFIVNAESFQKVRAA